MFRVNGWNSNIELNVSEKDYQPMTPFCDTKTACRSVIFWYHNCMKIMPRIRV
ncbi:hypothetical protein GJV10_15370 [Ewingella americana]|nr:hypothetical protein [Ewingella americana]